MKSICHLVEYMILNPQKIDFYNFLSIFLEKNLQRKFQFLKKNFPLYFD